MTPIKIIPKEKLVFDIDGKEYELAKPKVKDQKWFQAQMKLAKDSGNETEVISEYVQRLGLPVEVVDEMQNEQFLDLVQKLSGEKKTE